MSEKIGGLMMLDAIDMLEADPQADHYAYIQTSAPAVARKVLERARTCLSLWWCVSSDVSPPLRMKRPTVLPAVLKRLHESGTVDWCEKRESDLHPLNWQLIEEVRLPSDSTTKVYPWPVLVARYAMKRCLLPWKNSRMCIAIFTRIRRSA